MKYIKNTKLNEYTKLTWYVNLVVFYEQHSYHEEIREETTITDSDDSENSYPRRKQDNGN